MEMDYNKIYNKILTDEEFMEIKQHGSSDYPFQYYYDNLELFDFHCIEWHWHREFEFLYVESGQVTCGIGENRLYCQKEKQFLLILKYCTAFTHHQVVSFLTLYVCRNLLHRRTA